MRNFKSILAKRAINIVFITLLISGCSESVRNNGKNFTTESIVQIDSVAIREILKPVDMNISEHYICFLHDEEADGAQIYVFGADCMDFKYAFANRGQGPEDMMAPEMVKNMRGDTIELIDQANYKHLSYLLTDSGVTLLNASYLELPNMGPLQEVFNVNDSIWIFSTVDRRLLTYNTVANKVVSEFSFTDYYPEYDTRELQNFLGFNFTYNEPKIFVGMHFHDEIIEGQLNDDYSITFDKLPDLNLSEINQNKLEDNSAYNAFLCTDSSHVISQYYGYTMHDMQPFPRNLKGQNLKYYIDVYDTELNPLTRINPGIDILRLFADKYRHRVYFWNAMDDFTKLKYITID
ncbi:MAG: hypothetical protein K2M98_06930 [Muribaculum sp.]|nr:hypothetical protein [Muribaculum sp.]